MKYPILLLSVNGSLIWDSDETSFMVMGCRLILSNSINIAVYLLNFLVSLHIILNVIVVLYFTVAYFICIFNLLQFKISLLLAKRIYESTVVY